MDTEHRHDLAENDLVEFLNNLGPWWKKWGNTLTMVVLVAALAYLGRKYYVNSRTAAQEAAWLDLANAASPEVLLSVAESHEDPAVQALAYLRAADGILSLSGRGNGSAAGGTAGDETGSGLSIGAGTDPGESPGGEGPRIGAGGGGLAPGGAYTLDRAKGVYQIVAGDERYHVSYRLNALLGLATVAENQRGWDEAEAYYKEAGRLARGKYETIGRLTDARLAWLEKLKKPAHFSAASMDNSVPKPEPGDQKKLVPEGVAESPVPETTATNSNDGDVDAEIKGAEAQPDSDVPAPPITQPADQPTSQPPPTQPAGPGG